MAAALQRAAVFFACCLQMRENYLAKAGQMCYK